MNKDTKTKLKNKILRLIQDTETDIQALEEQTKPISPENSIGRVTRMDAIHNKSVAESNLRLMQQKLRKLHLASTKINEPNFGKCIRCNNAIQEKRLLFLPESSLCVNCASV